ncbi:hypothetical protein CYLTODRAFT_379887 [Cylindrobasidium torrendii FP15055 ss-10]|uniref:Tethering factor for nuclear proteasome STS1 n=1 Tax=Cylindrobasidium torrendii FP15055 ss-10 TaxID=1314674 RepID=A0A0D7B4J6_9AGAR|nr:hypothetical protein CYLTODRAFT_379887 [Cylindrobasidium torrendii FP15055 ss-10]
MTNVLSSPVDFQPRPVSYAPSPFGFGFGLASPAMYSPFQQASPAQPASPFGHFNSPAPSIIAPSTSSRPNKRRLEADEAQDEAMERSPTPGDRPKRGPPKRFRQQEQVAPRGQTAPKETKTPSEDSDVDIGVLLARLPKESLLPLLSKLITTNPSLKSSLLTLIPRPSVQSAIQALAESIKKLRDAHPFTNSIFSQPAPVAQPQQQGSSFSSMGFGFGSAARSAGFGQSTTFAKSTFGQPQTAASSGMRDDYIIGRIRPHVGDYVSVAMSYLPYFSQVPPAENASSGPRGKALPSETFAFLQALTSQMVDLPQTALTLMVPQVLPKLVQEWKAWVARVDVVVNQEAGIFGKDEVESWLRNLDAFAGAKDRQIAAAMRPIRDEWVAKVGWLAGRNVVHPMDE